MKLISLVGATMSALLLLGTPASASMEANYTLFSPIVDVQPAFAGSVDLFAFVADDACILGPTAISGYFEARTTIGSNSCTATPGVVAANTIG